MKSRFNFGRAKRLLKRNEESELALKQDPTTLVSPLWLEMQRVRGEAAWRAQGPARGMAAVLRLLAEKIPQENPHAWLLAEATKADRAERGE